MCQKCQAVFLGNIMFFMETNNIFSKNLIRLRKANSLSQRELAKKAGLSQRMIFYYENDPNTIPIKKLKALADSLNCTIADLFSEEATNPLDNIDIRWIKKIKDLKELSEYDRKEINRHISSLLEKNRLKKEKQLQKFSS